MRAGRHRSISRTTRSYRSTRSGSQRGSRRSRTWKAVDLQKILTAVPANPMLAEARARVGLLPKAQQNLLDRRNAEAGFSDAEADAYSARRPDGGRRLA